ncbi:MAG: hypothetical protein IJJ00_03965 [Erysipelotrichaceae bacterium]|nr:hypothetical protein [Erysipelotrichaceae bacterium]
MDKKLVKSLVLVVLGIVVMGTGIGMVSKIGIGVDSFTAVINGISFRTGLTLGTITALANAILCVIGYILCKKNVGLATILFIFISKWPVDFGYTHMIAGDNLVVKIILFVISVFIIALGAAMFIVSGMGANAYDAVTLGICERLNLKDKFVYVKYAMDGFMLIVAFIIGGPIGLGTIISLALIGIFMKFCQKHLIRIFRLEEQ